MPQQLYRTLIFTFICMIPLFAVEKTDSLSREKREANTVVGGTLQKIFSNSREKRTRRKDTFKRNSLGTKESTFSVGFEFEPTLVARYNFHHSLGFNLLIGGSLDHYNKWLFFKLGSHKFDMGKDDLLHNSIKDSTLWGLRTGLRYKNYTPRLVDQFVAPYILIDVEADLIYWEYKSGVKAEDGSRLKSDIVIASCLGAGGGITLFNRSHFRADFAFSAGIRIYEQRTKNLEDGSFVQYNNNPFDTDFYVRTGIIFWISREN